MSFFFCAPKFYGKDSFTLRGTKVAAALGVGVGTSARWFSLHNKDSKEHIEKWLPLTKNIMKWKNVRKCYNKSWVKQWKPDDMSMVAVQLKVYEGLSRATRRRTSPRILLTRPQQGGHRQQRGTTAP